MLPLQDTNTIYLVVGMLPPTMSLVAIVVIAIQRVRNSGAKDQEYLVEFFNCTQVGVQNDTLVTASDLGEGATISSLYILAVALICWGCVPYWQAHNMEQKMLRYQELQRTQEVDTEFSSASLDQSPGGRQWTSAWGEREEQRRQARHTHQVVTPSTSAEMHDIGVL